MKAITLDSFGVPHHESKGATVMPTTKRRALILISSARQLPLV